MIDDPRAHVFITANSPGEIAGWVAPVVEELKRRDPTASITVALPPCQYASGSEIEVASRTPGVDRVVRIKTLLREALFSGGAHRSRGRGSCVLYLGGDALYAVLLSKLLRLPACAYIGKPRWRKHFARYMVADERARSRFLEAGVEPERIETVGHLGLDSVRIGAGREEIVRRLAGEADDAEIVTFLPGSRPVEIEFLIPFFIETAEIMRELCPETIFCFAVSPFADRKLLAASVGRAGARIGRSGDLVCSGGCRIQLETENPQEAMCVSRLVITIPGTNNLQIAAMGVPMLIITPLNQAERIPMDGLLGMLDYRIFPVGLIKRRLILGMKKRVKYVSLPNIIAGREIVPEMLDILQPRDVAEKAVSLLRNPERRAQIVRDLHEIARDRGAAGRIADLVLGEGARTPQEVRGP